jgi:hypothetical protein
VIDVMTRSKVHHLAEMARPHVQIAADLGISLRSVERIVEEEVPPPARRSRRVRSCPASAAAVRRGWIRGRS